MLLASLQVSPILHAWMDSYWMDAFMRSVCSTAKDSGHLEPHSIVQATWTVLTDGFQAAHLTIMIECTADDFYVPAILEDLCSSIMQYKQLPQGMLVRILVRGSTSSIMGETHAANGSPDQDYTDRDFSKFFGR